jgi:hypothetical protein
LADRAHLRREFQPALFADRERNRKAAIETAHDLAFELANLVELKCDAFAKLAIGRRSKRNAAFRHVARRARHGEPALERVMPEQRKRCARVTAHAEVVAHAIAPFQRLMSADA